MTCVVIADAPLTLWSTWSASAMANSGCEEASVFTGLLCAVHGDSDGFPFVPSIISAQLK